MNTTCPCCGYKSVEEDSSACNVCEWKFDPYQAIDPDLEQGRNPLSLREAQHQFKAAQREVKGYRKDPKWCAFAWPEQRERVRELVIRYFDSCYRTDLA